MKRLLNIKRERRNGAVAAEELQDAAEDQGSQHSGSYSVSATRRKSSYRGSFSSSYSATPRLPPPRPSIDVQADSFGQKDQNSSARPRSEPRKAAESDNVSVRSRRTVPEREIKLRDLIDPRWDLETVKTNWVNQIIDEKPANNGGSNDPTVRVVRLELKGSFLNVYRNQREIASVERIVIDEDTREDSNSLISSRITAANDDATSFRNSTISSPQLVNHKKFDSNPAISDNNEVASLIEQFGAVDTHSVKNNGVPAVLPILPVDNTESRSGSQSIPKDQKQKTTELKYQSPSCPHPELIIDPLTGQIIDGSIEAIVHSILFFPSDNITDRLIEILPLMLPIGDVLDMFHKYFICFTLGNVHLSSFEMEIMFRRIRRVLDLFLLKFKSLIINDKVIHKCYTLLQCLQNGAIIKTLAPPKSENDKYNDYLPNSNVNLSELQMKLDSITKKVDVLNSVPYLEFTVEDFLSTDNSILANEIIALDYQYQTFLNPHNDLSILTKDQSSNPLIFNYPSDLHYVTELIYQHVLLKSTSPEQRGRLLTKWVELGQALYDSGDMTSFLGVALAICSKPIIRLCQSWSYVSPQVDNIISKWVPDVYNINNLDAFEILYPEGLSEKYSKFNLITFFGASPRSGNLMKVSDFVKLVDDWKLEVSQWENLLNGIEDQVHKVKYQIGANNEITISKKLRSSIINQQNRNVTLQNMIELSNEIEPFTAFMNYNYSNSRSPLFLRSYPSILFLDLLPQDHIFNLDKLISAISHSSNGNTNKLTILKYIRNELTSNFIDYSLTDNSVIFKSEIDKLKNNINNVSRQRLSMLSSKSFNIDFNDPVIVESLNTTVVNVKSASIDRLIDLLIIEPRYLGTLENNDEILQIDKDYFKTVFLETYKIFIQLSTLLDKLFKRFFYAKNISKCIAQNQSIDKWDELNFDDSPIDAKPVLEMQLNTMKIILELINSLEIHELTLDNIIENKITEFLETSNDLIQNEWTIKSKNFDNETFLSYNNLVLTYTKLKDIFTSKMFLPVTNGPMRLQFDESMVSIPEEWQIPLADEDLPKFMSKMENEIGKLVNPITRKDWIDCFNILQTLVSRSNKALFQYDSTKLNTHDGLISFGNVFHWINTLKNNSGAAIIDQLPPRIFNVFKMYNGFQDLILMQIVDPLHSQSSRVEIMFNILKMVSKCRKLSKKCNFNGSATVPSFLETILVNSIMMPISRFYSQSWIKAAQISHPFVDKFESLESMLPLDVKTPMINLSICPGWVMNRIMEIVCFVPNMDADFGNLLNFDKCKLVYDLVSQIVSTADSNGEMVLNKLKKFEFSFQEVYLNAVDECNNETIIAMFDDLINAQKNLIQIENERFELLTQNEDQHSIISEKLISKIPTQTPVTNQTALTATPTPTPTTTPIPPPTPTFAQTSETSTQSTSQKNEDKVHEIVVPSNGRVQSKSRLSMLKSRLSLISPAATTTSTATKTSGSTPSPASTSPAPTIIRKPLRIEELCSPYDVRQIKPTAVINLKLVKILPTYRIPNAFLITQGKSNGGELIYQCNSFEEMDQWIYLMNKHKCNWYKSVKMNTRSLPSNLTFGMPLKYLCSRDGCSIPIILEKLLSEIEIRGLEEVGLYRKSGSLLSIDKISKLIDTQGDLNMENSLLFDIHNICGVVKCFLRELPEPLIPGDLIDQLLQIKSSPAQQQLPSEKRFEIYNEVLGALPVENYCLIERMYHHLHLIEKNNHANKMTSYNLSTIMATYLIEKNEPEKIKKVFGLINFISEEFILNYSIIFSH